MLTRCSDCSLWMSSWRKDFVRQPAEPRQQRSLEADTTGKFASSTHLEYDETDGWHTNQPQEELYEINTTSVNSKSKRGHTGTSSLYANRPRKWEFDPLQQTQVTKSNVYGSVPSLPATSEQHKFWNRTRSVSEDDDFDVDEKPKSRGSIIDSLIMERVETDPFKNVTRNKYNKKSVTSR